MEKDLTLALKQFKENHPASPTYDDEIETYLHLAKLAKKVKDNQPYEEELSLCLDHYIRYFSVFDSISISSYNLKTNEDLDKKKAILSAIESFASYTRKDTQSISALICSYRYLLTLCELTLR